MAQVTPLSAFQGCENLKLQSPCIFLGEEIHVFFSLIDTIPIYHKNQLNVGWFPTISLHFTIFTYIWLILMVNVGREILRNLDASHGIASPHQPSGFEGQEEKLGAVANHNAAENVPHWRRKLKTLPETNFTKAPKNGCLEYKPFLLGMPIFRGYVSFRECTSELYIVCEFVTLKAGVSPYLVKMMPLNFHWMWHVAFRWLVIVMSFYAFQHVGISEMQYAFFDVRW